MVVARCYLRVSTEDQAKEGYSLGAQRDRLAAFAHSQGWAVGGYYVDDGVSAKDMNRPALRRMLADLVSGEIVLVYRLDRLTRNVSDLDALLGGWEAAGVQFRSCTEDFNTTTAAGRLFIRLVADLAQWERENLAERTRMGMAKRAQEGHRNGGPTPFGYVAVIPAQQPGQKVTRLLVPGEHAPVVQELFERYVAGFGIRQLTRWLNREKGVPSPRGTTFTDSSVSAILRNPCYAGWTAWGGNLSEGMHPPIVDRALWQLAQQVRKGRTAMAPRQATGPNPLTGVGRCGLCGSFLKANRGGKSGRLRYYRCGNYAARGSCSVASVPADAVEANFVAAVSACASAVADPERVREYAAAYLRERAATAQSQSPGQLQRQIGRARQAVSVWDRALEQHAIDLVTWRAKTEAVQAQLQDLTLQLQAAVAAVSSEAEVCQVIAQNLKSFAALWAAASAAERKTLARAFFREVRIYPDRRVEVLPRFAAPDAEFWTDRGDVCERTDGVPDSTRPGRSATAAGSARRAASLCADRRPSGGAGNPTGTTI